jgi:hypothetical protein
MAATAKVKGSAPKVRNANRPPGYWKILAAGRANRGYTLPARNAYQGINYPSFSDVGSAAYRRLQAKGRRV